MLSRRQEDSPFLIWLPPHEEGAGDRRTQMMFEAQEVQEQFEQGEANADEVLDALYELGWEPISYVESIEETLRKNGIC